MKKLLLFLSLAVSVGMSAQKKLAIQTSGENLTALSQVTDMETPCFNPYGGDYGKNLYFAVQEDKKYYNIYKKDNSFASAMSQKTSGKNCNLAPCYNEKLDKIAFRCQNEGSATSDIFTMPNTKGKALTQVTESSNAFEGNPNFSEDGKFLIYDRQTYSSAKVYTFASFLGLGESSILVEKSEVWIKNLETGENTLLGNGYQPCFSPDNKQIAYVKYSSDAKSSSIWTMDIDGSNPVQITDAKKGYACYPRWSPDGKKIVFQSTKKDKKDADLYVIDLDGNNLTQLTLNKSHDGCPYWTKDGYIYFTSDRGNKKGIYQIWRFKIQ